MGQGSSQLEGVVPGMRAAPEDADVQLDGLQRIAAFLAAPADARQHQTLAVGCGAVEAAVDAARTHRGTRAVVVAACGVLQALTDGCRAGAAAAVRAGAVDVLARLISCKKDKKKKKKGKKSEEEQEQEEEESEGDDKSALVSLAAETLASIVKMAGASAKKEVTEEEEQGEGDEKSPAELLSTRFAKKDVLGKAAAAMDACTDSTARCALCGLVAAYAGAAATDKGVVDRSAPAVAAALAALCRTPDAGADVLVAALQAVGATANSSAACRDAYAAAHVADDLVAQVHGWRTGAACVLAARLTALGFLCAKNADARALAVRSGSGVLDDVFDILADAWARRGPDGDTPPEVHACVFVLAMLAAHEVAAVAAVFGPEDTTAADAQKKKKKKKKSHKKSKSKKKGHKHKNEEEKEVKSVEVPLLEKEEDEDEPEQQEEQQEQQEVEEETTTTIAVPPRLELLLAVLGGSTEAPGTQRYCLAVLGSLPALVARRGVVAAAGVLEAAAGVVRTGARAVAADALKCVRKCVYDDARVHAAVLRDGLLRAAVDWVRAALPRAAGELEEACLLLRALCVHTRSDASAAATRDAAVAAYPGVGRELYDALVARLAASETETVPAATREAVAGALAEDMMLAEADRALVPGSALAGATAQLLFERGESAAEAAGLAHALADLARHTLVCADDMALVPVTVAMRRHADAPDVQTATSRVLYHLFMRSKWAVAPAAHEGALELLLAVVARAAAEPALRPAAVYATPALAEAAKLPEPAAHIAAGGALPALDALLCARPAPHEDLLQSCFMLAMTVARASDANRVAVAQSPLLAHMLRHLTPAHSPTTTVPFILKTLATLALARDAAAAALDDLGDALVAPLVALLREMRTDTRLAPAQEHAALALANIAAKCPRTRAAIVAAGGIAELLALLRSTSGSPEIARSCCLALGVLAFTDDVAVDPVAAAVVATADKKEEEDDEEKDVAATAVVPESGAAILASEGAIEAIVREMRVCDSDASVQQYGCIALGNIVHHSRERCDVLDAADGLGAVTAAMHMFPFVAPVQTEALRTIAKYTATDDTRRHARTLGRDGAELVVAALVQFPDVAALQEVAAKVVRNTARDSGHLKRFYLRNDVCATLTAHVRALPTAVAFQAVALEALEALDPAAAQDAVVDDDTKVESMLQRLRDEVAKEHDDDEEQKEDDEDEEDQEEKEEHEEEEEQEEDKVLGKKNVQEMITMMTGNKKMIDLFVEKGVVAALAPYMKAMPRSMGLAQQCCRAAFVLCEGSEEGRTQLVKRGLVGQLLGAMAQFAHDSQVQKYACGVFSVLAMNSDKCIAAVVAAGGVPLVLAALRHHRGDSDVQRFAGFALSALVLARDPAVAAALADGSAAVAVLESMRSQMRSAPVLEYDMLALANICLKCSSSNGRSSSSSSRGGVETVMAHGGVDAVVAALHAHPDSPKMVKNALYLGAALMAGTNEAARVAFARAEPPVLPLAVRVLETAEAANPAPARCAFLFCANLALTAAHRPLFATEAAARAIAHAYDAVAGVRSAVCEAGRAVAKITLDCAATQTLLLRAGLVPALARVLEAHTAVPQIVLYHCTALGQLLSAVPAPQAAPLLGARAIDAVYDVVKHNSCLPATVEALAFAVSRAVVHSAADRDYFARRSALPVCLFLLRQLGASAAIAAHTADMLRALLLGCPALAAQFAAADAGAAPALLLALAQTHMLDARAAAALLACLAAVAHAVPAALAAGAGVCACVPLALVAAQTHPHARPVQEAVAALLAALVRAHLFAPTDAPLLRDCAAALSTAARQFPDSSPIADALALVSSPCP